MIKKLPLVLMVCVAVVVGASLMPWGRIRLIQMTGQVNPEGKPVGVLVEPVFNGWSCPYQLPRVGATAKLAILAAALLLIVRFLGQRGNWRAPGLTSIILSLYGVGHLGYLVFLIHRKAPFSPGQITINSSVGPGLIVALVAFAGLLVVSVGYAVRRQRPAVEEPPERLMGSPASPEADETATT